MNTPYRTPPVFVGTGAVLLSFFVMLVSLTTPANGADVNAASCASSDVQTAINTAASGGRVLVHGPCNATWSTTVTISGKALTLQGDGVGIVNITCGGSGVCLSATGSNANFVDVSGFTFIMGSANSDGAIQIGGPNCAAGCTDFAFRFHHSRLLNASASGGRGIGVHWVYGLIDHVTFDITDAGGSDQMITVEGSSVGSDGGFTPWMRPTALGNAMTGNGQAVFIEDNTFSCVSNNEDAIDAYTGARLVIRHNAFNHCTMGWHGTDSGFNRSLHSAEIHSNTWTNPSLRAIGFRGGTGIIWGNSSQNGAGIEFNNYRSCPRDGSDTSAWGACNGSNYGIGDSGSAAAIVGGSFSAQASRTAAGGAPVKFCSGDRDKPCTQDSHCTGFGTCTTFFDGAGASGYACRDQVGMGHGQASVPIYVWSNTNMSVGVNNGPGSCSPSNLVSASIIVNGRDYVQNGTTPKPGYTAFTYPHPLQGGSPTSSNPPTGVTVR